MKLETAAKYMNADTSGFNPALLEKELKTVAIDSREVKAGDVFFALSQPEYKNNGFNGEFADSTKFVGSALENGAICAVVRPDRFIEHNLEVHKEKVLRVQDCILALQNLAHGVYSEWNKPVVAITGSAGKTTARELTAHVLRESGRSVLSSEKNYNNGLGQPLTVLRILSEGNFDLAVLEMGMSTPNNEIARLCRITPPDVAVELNVLPVHIEHLGTIERIRQAKAELVEGMKPGGTAVLNADDPRVASMRDLSKGKTITYGIDNPADVMAKNIRFKRFGETTFDLQTPDATAEVFFPLNGKHNVMNALASSAVGLTFGMSVAEIAEALKTVKPASQRGEILRFAAGFTVINDSYNSNPDALISMVKTVVDGGTGANRKIIVAGEMRELGENSVQMHTDTGEIIAGLGIDALYGVEGLAKNLIDGAKRKGLSNVAFYENSAIAGESLVSEVQAGDLILVKGSRGVKTEKVIEKLLQTFELED